MSAFNVTSCETCGRSILVCDNDVWLEWPAVPYDEHVASWTLMVVGDIVLAANGEPGLDGRAHKLHLHQPLERT